MGEKPCQSPDSLPNVTNFRVSEASIESFKDEDF